MILADYRDPVLLHEGVRTTIHRARRASDDQPVVLKRLREPFAAPRDVSRLRREYDFARAAVGAGVPAMFALHARDGAAWLEMEDCPGESLRALRTRGPLEVREALEITRGLLGILEHAHRAGVIHGDLNPQNVIRDPSSRRLWIVDFGTARTAQPYLPKRTDRIEGTPGYMSPEQTGRMNRAVDVRSDYYALGATLYHLLTGVPPFAGDDANEVVYAQMARQAVPPREREPNVPAVVSDVVMTLLAKDADGRYQSVAGLRTDIDACLAGLDGNGGLAPFARCRGDRTEALRIPDRLYGREEDLAALEGAIARVTAGVSEAIFIAGPAGSGKTSLIGEALRGATMRRALFVSGKFEQFRRDVPYASVVAALRQLVQQVLALDPDRIATWRGRLGAALGETGGVLTDVLPELELLVGKQPAPADVSAVDGEHRFRNSLARLIAALPAPGAPVVLCFDDLQWADLASIALVEHLLVEPALGGVLLLGTFRSNDVDDSHPLTRALSRARELGAAPSVRLLGPLGASDVEDLLADTLAYPVAEVRPLAELAHAWTGGNPFLVRSVVEGLRDDGLLTLAAGVWRWSLADIQKRGLGDDAALYVAGRVRELPSATRRALEVASCLGTRFPLRLLATVLDCAPEQAYVHLSRALSLNLVFALDEHWWPGAGDDEDTDFAFAHDRIQEAAHVRLSREDEQEIHLRAGRALAERPDADLFDVVHHLNLAIPLLAPDERAALLLRDADAGRRALRSGAFGPALTLLDHAVELLPEDARERNGDPVRALLIDAARAASLAGDSARMDRHLEAALAMALSPLHRVAALEVRALDRAGRDIFGAIEVALAGLADLGLQVPREPTMADVGARIGGAMAALGSRGAEGVVALSELEDPTTAAAVSLANAIMAPAYVAVPLLLPILSAEIMRMTIERGVTPSATYGYAVMALVLTGTGALAPGHDLGQLCLRLLERFNHRGHDVRPGHVLMGLVLPHTMPIREAVAKHRQYLPRALAAGDHEYAMWIAHLSLANAFYAGLPLDELAVDLERETRAMHRLGQKVPFDCTDPQRRLVRALRGDATRPDRLDGGGRSEEEELATLVATGSRGAAYVLSTQRIFQRFLFRDFEGAVQAADAGEAFVDGVMATYHPIIFGEMLALACIALAESATSPEAREALLERARKNRAALDPYVAHAPHNHRQRTRLIDAELARLSGDPLAAMDAYDEAIEAARDNGFVQDEAIANELAGRFFRSRGKLTSARAYLLEACSAYARWGATAKLRQLEVELPDLVGPRASAAKGPITIDVTGDDLDLASVWESTRVITSEIRTDRLVDRILTVSVENAGATRGLLLLEHDGKLWLEAARGEEAPPLGTELADLRQVPGSILQYVARTGEQVTLADARSDPRFASDPAIRPDRPLSVVALPLVIGGHASGLIYLENDLIPGAFSRARGKLLAMLGAQAAISLANARLYKTLEETLRELARREKQLSDFLEAVPVGVFVTDPTGRPLYANSAAQRLLGRGIATGQEKEHLAEIFQAYVDGTDDLYPTEQMPIVQALSGRNATCRDMEVRNGEGRRLLGVTASPVRDETGQLQFAIAAFEDITAEQRAHELLEDYSKTLEQEVKERTRAAERAQETAEAASSAKSVFLASMSHELRTPMNAIIGFTRIVLRRSGDGLPTKQRENLEKVLTSGNHLLALINDVLDLSKIEAGRMDLRMSDVALVRLATECVQIAESLAEARSQTLSLEARGEVFAMADADKVREVLLNLIGNAVKYTREGGRITVRCYAEAGSVCLAVDDTGVGIAAESLEDVFVEFWQSQGGTSRQSGGTGLGLAISRRLARAMGGDVSVASELGQGSTFTLTLPEAKSVHAKVESSSASSVSGAASLEGHEGRST